MADRDLSMPSLFDHLLTCQYDLIDLIDWQHLWNSFTCRYIPLSNVNIYDTLLRQLFLSYAMTPREVSSQTWGGGVNTPNMQFTARAATTQRI